MRLIATTISLFIILTLVRIIFGIPTMFVVSFVAALSALTLFAVAVNKNNRHVHIKEVPVPKSNPPSNGTVR